MDPIADLYESLLEEIFCDPFVFDHGQDEFLYPVVMLVINFQEIHVPLAGSYWQQEEAGAQQGLADVPPLSRVSSMNFLVVQLIALVFDLMLASLASTITMKKSHALSWYHQHFRSRFSEPSDNYS